MKILGLDIGTNSIGGALVNIDKFGESGSIEWLGSRIIPVEGDYLQKFESGGQVETKSAARRQLRMSRRLKQRYVLRRTRLIKVLKILGWMPEEFPDNFKKELAVNPDFKFQINKHLPFDKSTVDEAAKLLGVPNKEGQLSVSEDWIVYYLRKKALYEKISLQELARIIYMLNQRRGFKSSRKDNKPDKTGEEEKFPKIEKWVEILQVNSITEEKKEKDKILYKVIAGSYEGIIVRKTKPEWENKEIELEITKKTTKSGEVSYTFSVPNPTEWEKQKKALNDDIKDWIATGKCKAIGEYFFLHLAEDKNYRIRQRIVDREWYQKELSAIWAKQSEFYPEFSDKSLLHEVAMALYPVNKDKQREIESNDLLHVLSNDIIYYQRSLKSQKHLISECRFEKKCYQRDGVQIQEGYKVAPKSCPAFQEFRIWQDIHNIRIIEKEHSRNGRSYADVDVTADYINNDVKADIFNLFDSCSDIDEQALLKRIGIRTRDTHKINLYANRQKLKGNETKAIFRKVFKKHGFDGEHLLANADTFYRLWHVMYSLEEKEEIVSALKSRKNKFGLPDDVVRNLSNLPGFPKAYASISSKAIKKLLPLMRTGRYWSMDSIPQPVINKIEKLLTGEVDEDIDSRTRDQIVKLDFQSINDFQGLSPWIACYVVYGRHSERENNEKFADPNQIDAMKLVPYNSLRNPLVEQIVRETIQIVKDVWLTYGRPDEIHIELGRELKKNSEERKKLAENAQKNYDERERIKKLLEEFKKDMNNDMKLCNPNSASDIEKFKIWKSLGGTIANDNFNQLFNKKNEIAVSSSEIEKYRLWADQNHVSPYTGRNIPLSRLFTSEYEVEHIIPRSRLKYDSPENLVICESAINKEKDNDVARVFIQKYSGNTIHRDGREFDVLKEEAYVQHCLKTFRGAKLKNLLREDIPDDFILRQLNDTRYITRKVSELLFPVAKGTPDNPDGIVFTGGSITNDLKNQWGLKSLWKDLVKPRFVRLEEITGEKFIIIDNENANKFHLEPPDSKLDIKRIDHRHHALDALVIAATTREHIRYINSLSSANNDEDYLKRKYTLVKGGIRDFRLPWETFTREARQMLDGLIVSHKVNNHILTKPYNKYQKWVQENGEWKKILVKQEPNDRWLAVRRSLFKEPQGIVYLKEVREENPMKAVEVQFAIRKGNKDINGKPRDYIYDQDARIIIREIVDKAGANLEDIKNYLRKNKLRYSNGEPIEKVRIARFVEKAAKRVSLDESFDHKKIDKIPYAHKEPFVAMLHEHLREFGDNAREAFTGEGLEALNKKAGHPVKKVTIAEKNESAVRLNGKLLEIDKGGNVYFVIYENLETKSRKDKGCEMRTLSVLDVVNRRLAGEIDVEELQGYKSIVLSPNDLVYVPTLEETVDPCLIDWNDRKKIMRRVYKMVSSTGNRCFFVPHFIAKALDSDFKELGANNKAEKSWDKINISQACIKIKVDRLGNIIWTSNG